MFGTIRNAVIALALVVPGHGALALSLSDVIHYVLETNPEIKSAEANKQAIEFELEQARSFYHPRVEVEAWAGGSRNNGTTTPDLSAANDTISGYELNARFSQMLFDGYKTRSEVERQAYRIDAAAYRVLERSEVLSLEAIRLFSDVRRSQALLDLARRNQDYHKEVYDRLETGFQRGVIGIGDLQQGEERLYLAQDTVLEFQYNLEDSQNLFLAVVGVKPSNLGTVPNMSASIPSNLDAALSTARRSSPTIQFLQADVGSTEALSRRVNANQFPTLSLEADGRVGEDVGGFYGDRADAKVGVVLRYDFQGSGKRAARQEQARRVNESRSQLLAHTRRVEAEVRQSWSTLRSAQRRLTTIQAQATLSRELRENYEQEFLVGSRSLLDVLNTQNALFQAEANLINARSLDNYVKYRLLASIGVLLPTLGIEPPEDAKVYARKKLGVPGVNMGNGDNQFNAKTFTNWRKSLK